MVGGLGMSQADLHRLLVSYETPMQVSTRFYEATRKDMSGEADPSLGRGDATGNLALVRPEPGALRATGEEAPLRNRAASCMLTILCCIGAKKAPLPHELLKPCAARECRRRTDRGHEVRCGVLHGSERCGRCDRRRNDHGHRTWKPEDLHRAGETSWFWVCTALSGLCISGLLLGTDRRDACPKS